MRGEARLLGHDGLVRPAAQRHIRFEVRLNAERQRQATTVEERRRRGLLCSQCSAEQRCGEDHNLDSHFQRDITTRLNSCLGFTVTGPLHARVHVPRTLLQWYCARSVHTADAAND